MLPIYINWSLSLFHFNSAWANNTQLRGGTLPRNTSEIRRTLRLRSLRSPRRVPVAMSDPGLPTPTTMAGYFCGGEEMCMLMISPTTRVGRTRPRLGNLIDNLWHRTDKNWWLFMIVYICATYKSENEWKLNVSKNNFVVPSKKNGGSHKDFNVHCASIHTQTFCEKKMLKLECCLVLWECFNVPKNKCADKHVDALN